MLASILVAAALAAQTQAEPPAPAPASATAAESKEGSRVICRRDIVTGSRVQKRRTCMTAREWERAGAATRDDVGDYLRKATAGAPRGG